MSVVEIAAVESADARMSVVEIAAVDTASFLTP